MILIFPTGVVARRRSFPVPGSLISRPGRTTAYSLPTRTPPVVPTLMTSSLPDTSATSAVIGATVSGIFGAAAASWMTRLSTAVRVASPRMVPARSALHVSWPRRYIGWSSSSVFILARFDSPLPRATPRISPVPICTIRASIATVALDSLRRPNEMFLSSRWY